MLLRLKKLLDKYKLDIAMFMLNSSFYSRRNNQEKHRISIMMSMVPLPNNWVTLLCEIYPHLPRHRCMLALLKLSRNFALLLSSAFFQAPFHCLPVLVVVFLCSFHSLLFILLHRDNSFILFCSYSLGLFHRVTFYFCFQSANLAIHELFLNKISLIDKILGERIQFLDACLLIHSFNFKRMARLRCVFTMSL